MEKSDCFFFNITLPPTNIDEHFCEYICLHKESRKKYDKIYAITTIF